jgi:hypothetical protein
VTPPIVSVFEVARDRDVRREERQERYDEEHTGEEQAAQTDAAAHDRQEHEERVPQPSAEREG